MVSTRKATLLHRTVLLAVAPFVVGSLIPAAATADKGSPTPGPSRGGASHARADEPDKVTICHRTNSRTNPYDQIVVSTSAAISSHAYHVGPIFGPDVEEWGDIIPPIRPGLPHGLNWPEGRAILHNGCEMDPDVGPRPHARVGDLGCVGTTRA